MLPKWHILLGIIFSILLYFLLELTFFQTSLVFLSSILIDFDHYLFYAKRKKDWNLKRAYKWNRDLPKNHKPIVYILHTIEFLVFVGIFSFYYIFFRFILIGMLFHSIFDILEMLYIKALNSREFSLVNYLISDKRKYF